MILNILCTATKVSNASESQERSGSDGSGRNKEAWSGFLLEVSFLSGESASVKGLHFSVVTKSLLNAVVVLRHCFCLLRVLFEGRKLFNWDGLDLTEDGPCNSLRARGSGEGARVGPEVLRIERFSQNFSEISLSFVVSIVKGVHDRLKEGILIKSSRFVKENAKDSIFLSFRVLMHNVHLGLIELSVDRMLWGCVEVELHRLHFEWSIIS